MAASFDIVVTHSGIQFKGDDAFLGTEPESLKERLDAEFDHNEVDSGTVIGKVTFTEGEARFNIRDEYRDNLYAS